MLREETVFGPIFSRRLGSSLGINLLPEKGKICNFDCVYCECGWNRDGRDDTVLPTAAKVRGDLERMLKRLAAEGTPVDSITFSGDGEPTLNPDFPQIIGDTLRLRGEYYPQAKVSVLSNATYLDRPAVHEALLRVDNNIQKLDTVNPAYIARLDRPVSPRYRVEQVIERLKDFQGKVIVQTMFLTGIVDGVDLDNTGDAYVQPWLEALRRIAPQQVMIYTIDRETPDPRLRKASPASLDAICLKVQAAGFPCSVSY